VLEFEARLDGVYVQGVDMLRWNDEGKLVSVTVMAPPLRDPLPTTRARRQRDSRHDRAFLRHLTMHSHAGSASRSLSHTRAPTGR
jgi:hypothetical protein